MRWLTPSQQDDLHRLFSGEWWSSGRRRADVSALLAASAAVVGLVDRRSGRLVAFARVSGDLVYRGVVQDVIVAPSHRGEGLGHALIEALLADPRVAAVESLALTCLPDKVGFYERHGFRDARTEAVLMRRGAPVVPAAHDLDHDAARTPPAPPSPASHALQAPPAPQAPPPAPQASPARAPSAP